MTLLLTMFFSTKTLAYDVEVDGIYYNLVKKIARVTRGDQNYTRDIVIFTLTR